MGYSTDFHGQFKISPPLNRDRINYLTTFSGTRRVKRLPKLLEDASDPLREAVNLPIGVDGSYFLGNSTHDECSDVGLVSDNTPPGDQPSLRCPWTVSADGSFLIWDELEKAYSYVEWLDYLINHFFRPWGHSISGKVKWVGEDSRDKGTITIKDNDIEIEVRGKKYSGVAEQAVVASAEAALDELKRSRAWLAAPQTTTDVSRTIEQAQDKIYARTIAAIEPDLFGEDQRARSDALRVLADIGLEGKRVSVPILQRMLKASKVDSFRADIAVVLSKIAPEDADAARALVPALQDQRPKIRREAAELLAYAPSKPKEAIQPLIGLISDRDKNMREIALTAVANIAPASISVPLLIAALSDKAVSVRKAAVRCLEESGEKSERVIVALKGQKHNPELKGLIEQALSSLGAFETPDDLRAVIVLLDSPVPMKREAAIQDLVRRIKSGEPVFEMMHTAYSETRVFDLRARIAWALGRIGPDAAAATPLLIKALQDPNDNVQRSAALALTQIGPGARAALPALKDAFKFTEIAVKVQAERAIKAIEGGT